jgi:hypothetical protein
LLAFLATRAAWAGLFRFESDSQFSARQSAVLSAQQEVYQYIQSSYAADERRYSLDASFSLYDDLSDGSSKLDLFALNGQWSLAEGVRAQVGRQFNSYLLARTAISDSAFLEWDVAKTGVTLFAFLGELAQNEVKSAPTETDLYGVGARYKSNAAVFPFRASASVERLDYRGRGTSEDIAKLAATQQFNAYLEPELQWSAETSLDSGNLNRMELAASLYPGDRGIFAARLLEYELSSLSGWEDPISTIIAQGRIYEAGASWSQALGPRVRYTLDAGYDQFVLLPGQAPAQGGRMGVSLDWSIGERGHGNDQVFYLAGYGGTAVANIFRIEAFVWRETSVFFSSEAVAYNKITSSARNAYSTQLGLGALAWGHFKAQVLGEYDSNNDVGGEARILGRLIWMEWSQI